MKNAMKKLLSLALALVLVVGVFPMAAFATETEAVAEAAETSDPLDNRTVQKFLDDCGDDKDAVIAAIRAQKLEDPNEIINFIVNWQNMNVAKPEETEAATEAVEEEAPTYTVYLYVYEMQDDEAKEWGNKTVTLDKNSATLSELAAAAGYTKYESISAKINGASFEGRAEIAIEDGDQVDLYVSPAKPSKPADKEEPKPSKGEKVTLSVWHNDGTSNYTNITCRTTDNLLEVIEDNDELMNLSRDGYELIGWAFEANNDDGDWIAAQHKVSDDDDLKVFADWQETKKPGSGSSSSENVKGNFLLKIYANFNTEKCMTVNIDEYAEDGKISWGDAYKVVCKYYEQAEDDDDMDMIGLFTKDTWNGGDYDDDDAKEKIYVDEGDKLTVYVMIYDAKLISDSDDDIVMRIYLNGNTTTVAKVVNMEKYAADGKIKISEATKVIEKYYEEKYDDDDMDIDGLFTAKTWNDGDYNMKNAADSIKVNENGDTIIYVMVRDAQKISSGTADPSNPKTGDTIFMAVTVMALSASALAAVYVFSKKRAAK